jgi:GT2 family glycosyltransferase
MVNAIGPGPQGGAGERNPKIALDRPVSVLAPAGLVSILIPCCGMLEYTKLCVPSVMRHSRIPFEVIFLDIGSLDGTAEYLAGVAAAPQVRVEVVRTPTDLGIAEVVQEALDQARGEYLVLLNNDTVVTPYWLDQMIALAKMSPTVGLVGPMSNYAAPPQLVETVPYRIGPKKGVRSQTGKERSEVLVDVSAVHAFAREFHQKNKGNWVAPERLGGFCLLLKREVLLKIGPLDAAAGLGLFDTDLLSLKARQAGYTLACCCDLFIHHFGTRTFAHGAPVEESRLRGGNSPS